MSTHQRITENNIISTYSQSDYLLEKILHRDNMNLAYKRVKANRGAEDVDGIDVDELLTLLRETREHLIQQIKDVGN